MKQMLCVYAVVCMSVFIPRVWAQKKGERVAVADMGRILESYWKYPLAEQRLKHKVRELKLKFRELDKEHIELTLEHIKVELAIESPVLSQAARQRKMQEAAELRERINEKANEIKRRSKERKGELNRFIMRERTALLKEIREIIAPYAEKEGYSLIIDNSGNLVGRPSTLIYFKPALDITDKLLKILNKGHEGKASAP